MDNFSYKKPNLVDETHQETRLDIQGQNMSDETGSSKVIAKMSFLDRFLPLWIALAITLGLLLGNFVPSVNVITELGNFDGVSLPICIGLIWMMYPILAKVNYELIPKMITTNGLYKQLIISVFLNWIVGPALMTLLAWLTLGDLQEYRDGIILVGLARCIAMVMIWNNLALGSGEFCALLVAINSILQIALYGPLSILIIRVIPEAMGYPTTQVDVSTWTVVKGVLIYLGIPLALGVITRYSLLFLKGRHWYDSKFMPYFGPTSLLGLLFTIIILFSVQGKQLIQSPGEVARLAVPLLLYFIIMFFGSFLLSFILKVNYEIAVSQAFTASGNNFELAIAVCITTFGVHSPQALGAVIGPLIEVPILLALVYVALYFKAFYIRKINESKSV